MNYENLNIEMRGIHPSSHLDKMLRDLADAIHWQSPSDSCLKIFIEQSKGTIKASCRIASQTGVFVANSVSDCPEKSLRMLEQKIQKKLDEWKRNRFSNILNQQFETAS